MRVTRFQASLTPGGGEQLRKMLQNSYTLSASSFHDETLLALGDEANDAAPGEPTVLRRIDAHLKILALTI